jgi:translation elongation factor EF-G
MLALGAFVVMPGCSSKEDKVLFEKIDRRHKELQTLQQSEQAIFRAKDANETLVIATYLPQKDEKEEHFILAVHPAGKMSYFLGGKAPVSLRPMKHRELQEPLRSNVPSWFDVSEAVFPHVPGKKLSLKIQTSEGSSQTLLFYRGPKYLVTKPKF